MLNFSVAGPFENARFYIVYLTPGCNIMTPVSEFTSESTAMLECVRLNHRQREMEEKKYVVKFKGFE